MKKERKPLEFHDLYWLVWLLLVFLPYELYAAVSKKKGDTLSETNWGWLGVNRPNAKYGKLRRINFIAFWVALGFHFAYATSVAPVVFFGGGIALSVAYHYMFEGD